MASTKIVDELDARFAEELTASAQYYVHSGFLRSWGCAALASEVESIARKESEHARELTDRLYFLGYKPDAELTPAGVKLAKTVTDVLNLGLASEKDAVKKYNATAKLAREQDDIGTAIICEHILVEEEEHQLFFTKQIEQLKKQGEENYVSSQSGACTSSPMPG